MYDARKIVPGLIIFFALIAFPLWLSAASGGINEPPELTLPANEDKCIEPVEFMRSDHMNLLIDWREEVVRRNERIYTASDGQQYTKSLTDTCLSCHSPKSEFCDRCHDYVGVQPTCWTCHVDPEAEQGGTDGN